MRYPAAIAVFLLLSLSIPLQAQRGGGGHASAGGHGGFSGHSSFGGHSFVAARSGSSFTSRSFASGWTSLGRAPLNRSFSGPLSSRRFPSRKFNRSTGLRIRTRDFRNSCFGFPCRGFGGGID